MNIETILYQLKDGYSLTEIVENPTKEKFIISVLKDYSQLKAEKSGEWVVRLIGSTGHNTKIVCSKCTREVTQEENYCPNCGAKMKKEENQ